MNLKSVTAVAAGVGAVAFQAPATELANLRLSVDIAGVVMVGALVWGVAKMSGSIDQLKEVTKDLTSASKEFARGLVDMGLRIRVLEVKDGERDKLHSGV